MADEEDDTGCAISVVCGDSGVVFEYPCYVLPDRHGGFCELVAVCFIDRKLLVAVPFGGWNRAVAKRVLPEKALTKAVVVEVEQCAPYQQESAEAEDVMKVWMGFLADSLLNLVQEPGEEEVALTVFADGEFVGFLPYAGSLEAAAREHFAFLSATEGHEVPSAVPPGSGSGYVDPRDARLERLEHAGEVDAQGRQAGLGQQARGSTSSSSSSSACQDRAKQSTREFGQVPRPGSQCGCSCDDRRRGEGSPSGDAEVDADWEGQAEEVARPCSEQSPVCTRSGCAANPIGIRLRRTSRRRSRRFWRSSTWWQFACCYGGDEADGARDRTCGGQAEEEGFQGRGGIGWNICLQCHGDWWAWLWKENCSGAPRIAAGPSREPRRDLSDHREGDVGGPHKPDLHSGSTSSYAVLEGMDRAPQQNRSLEDFCSLRLDGGGCLGQVDQRRCGRMQGEARASSAHAGSDRLRQGQLVSVERAVAGEPSAYGSFESACPASGGRRRAALQPSPGSALGGGCHVSHTRDGGLCDEADEAWEEGGQRASRSETKTKGKSQGRRQARPFVRRSAAEAGGMSSPGEVAEGSSMRVPGAAAPEIDVPAFVNSWPRLLLKCNGRLAVFLHSILSATSLLCDEGTPDQALWPLPLPYPEVFRSGVNVLDGWKKRRLCLQLVVLDWLYLGQPAAAPKSLKLGQRLTPGQWRIVRLLESLADDANSIVKVDAAGMGRCASKAETQDEELGALHRALLQVQQSAPKYGGGSFSCTTFTPESEKKYAGSVVGKMTGKPFVAAKALQAERIQFGPPPSFDPFPYMDPKTASMYEQPGLFHKDAHDAPPHVSVRATAEEKMSLFLKMAACGRLKLLKADEVEEAFASGLFAVTKDLARDRLIMDSRPANCREIGLNHWCGAMANASMLGQIVLEDGEELLMSGQDVKDFFYQFVVGSERAAEIAWLVALMRVTWRSFFQIPRCHPRVALLD